LIQQGGAGGFACRSHGHNQWSASKLNKSRKRRATRSSGASPYRRWSRPTSP